MGDATPESPALGNAYYYPNTEGTTNHRFTWTLSETELEQLTHDQSTLPVNIVRYIRFKAKQGVDAPYPFVYVKMEANLTRADIASTKFAEKNDNYWFGLDGSDAGWEAAVFDVKEPVDGGDIILINRGVRSTLVGNTEKITENHKYYFAPKPVSITALNGKAYTITPQSSASDTKWNKLICKYITADTHVWSEATLDATLNKCAIDYSAGAFNNAALYAVNAGTYTKIATLNQTTGDINLINNPACQDVLNAIGYTPNHANINTEMRAWLGVVAETKCGLAEKVEDGIFLASWQRPINMKELGNQVAVDAKTNGNIIYLLDFLKLFDWRGEEVGYMWGDQQWFWAYYNVKAITVNTDPSVVETNMHNGGNVFKKLNEITTEAELYSYPSMTKGATRYPFSLYPTYDRASQNTALLAYMGIDPDDPAQKEKFGAIYCYTAHQPNTGSLISKTSMSLYKI